MADKAVAAALQLLAAQVTFREESEVRAFEEAVAEIAGEAPAGGDLGDLTKAELVSLAEAAGIVVEASDTKADLVAKLEEEGS